MASVVITLRVMPDTPEADLHAIEKRVSELVQEFGGSVGKVEHIPVAFGLKSLNVIFVMDESLGSTEELEKEAAAIPHVNSVEVTDVRRAIG
ncbi:elongation factor 1-beta [Candidatus Woesearchaeota archaeon]|nr:elongation factor 1-beta [Candidatus Woesearchaeota archaeon]